jgi:hypothetical protein
VVVAVSVLARPPAPEVEGGWGAARPASKLPWPPQSFWDRFGGPTHKCRSPPPPPPLPGRPVEIDFGRTPLGHALAIPGRAAGVPIVLDPAVPTSLAAAPVSLTTDAVCLRDALDLVLMQAAPEGEIVFDLLGDSILVRPR